MIVAVEPVNEEENSPALQACFLREQVVAFAVGVVVENELGGERREFRWYARGVDAIPVLRELLTGLESRIERRSVTGETKHGGGDPDHGGGVLAEHGGLDPGGVEPAD